MKESYHWSPFLSLAPQAARIFNRTMSSVLLHTCCGPCAAVCVERLRAERHDVTLYFSNANIGDQDEYARRLEAAERLADAMSVPLIVDEAARHADWLAAVSGHEGAPEGGMRCRRCFAFSLKRTAAQAAAISSDHFTTTLSVSPHKNSHTLMEVGREADATRFLTIDFKKQGGYQRSVSLARDLGLYRQNYCGCEFSRRDNDQGEEGKGTAT